ncbi:MAG: hypothetical protein LBG52_07750 [Candidatus Peribacteria bacterium]|nr:hypothetical protein [Candidatus Peribacteria bacterium]
MLNSPISKKKQKTESWDKKVCKMLKKIKTIKDQLEAMLEKVNQAMYNGNPGDFYKEVQVQNLKTCISELKGMSEQLGPNAKEIADKIHQQEKEIIKLASDYPKQMEKAKEIDTIKQKKSYEKNTASTKFSGYCRMNNIQEEDLKKKVSWMIFGGIMVLIAGLEAGISYPFMARVYAGDIAVVLGINFTLALGAAYTGHPIATLSALKNRLKKELEKYYTALDLDDDETVSLPKWVKDSNYTEMQSDKYVVNTSALNRKMVIWGFIGCAATILKFYPTFERSVEKNLPITGLVILIFVICIINCFLVPLLLEKFDKGLPDEIRNNALQQKENIEELEEELKNLSPTSQEVKVQFESQKQVVSETISALKAQLSSSGIEVHTALQETFGLCQEVITAIEKKTDGYTLDDVRAKLNKAKTSK